MTSREYWNKREEEALKHYTKNEQEYQKRLNEIYQSTLDNCQKEIDSFFGKYAAKEGITIAEAKKRVSQLDIKVYERKAEKYVKDKDFSAKANEEMRLYNLTMKVNRLEMLKANIGLELIAGHDELDKYMSGILKGRTMEELQRQAGILGKTVSNAAQKANALVNASFRNANFSDRIWMYQDELKNDIGKLLTSGLIQGKNPRTLAKDLKARFGVSTSNAERLMRTELARVQTEAQKQSYQRNGWGKYEFIVNRGCCPICEALDGKHFSVDKMQAGFNAPPMHPNCRCATAPWEDSEEYEAWLDYLDKGGTTEEWEKLKANGGKEEPKTSAFAPAKSIEEAEEYGRRFLAEKKWEGNGNISYSGLSLESANKLNETLFGIFDKFDLPKLNNIQPMPFREKRWKAHKNAPLAYDSTSQLSGGLFFNTNFIKTQKTLAKYVAEGKKAYDICKENMHRLTGDNLKLVETYVKAGRSLVANDSADYMAAYFQHEIGHHIHQRAMIYDKDAVEIVDSGFDKYAIGISGYATQTKGEYVAESFCAYLNGEADRIDPKLKEYFEGLMK